MGWREQLRPASFRGVPFRVWGHDASGLARRVQTHEYPGRDRPYVEDLGRQTGSFRLEAYVLGENYFAERDALLEALSAAGAGTLVHPTLGTREVVCVESSLRETFREGGLATFSLAFVEAGENRFPVASPATASLVAVAAAGGRAQTRVSFLEAFQQGAVPQWVSDSAVRILEDLSEQLLGVTISVPDLAGDLDGLVRDLEDLGGKAAGFEADPESLVDRVLGSIRRLADLGASPERAINRLARLVSFGADIDPVEPSTPNRVKEAARQEALKRVVRRSAAIEAARRSSEVALQSYEGAVAIRDRVLGLLDGEIEAAGEGGDNVVFEALEGLYAAVSRDLTARGAKLARIRTITLPQALPSLVVAYQLYGDSSRADEIAERNRVRHPGFVPGGVPLEVLSA